ncbi:hypothetical protein [Thermoactinomyces sp. DSM 45892]|uniref:hypothetical protein n=1 Tax=Thermoactinomyces sp. DSM 45892 TaxID=1882753 RepID=UPI00089603DD|nr:hypothetical protein [Thermoactinomyces sp. DSM 45892]SDY88316.1 hypothetical protein SAMN05444416_109162 [Thermoactinomyces sp. DSM 45892]
MKIWETMKQIKKWFEYIPPEDEIEKPVRYRPQYDVHLDSSHASVTFNYERDIVNVADETPCYRCRKRPFCKVLNGRGYCMHCSTLQEVTDAESVYLDNMKWYPVGNFISEDGIYSPFLWRDKVDYVDLYAKYAYSDRVLKVVGLDGTIEAIAVSEMSDLELHQDRFVPLNSEWIDSITEDDRW